ncbi:MAG: hypothetical protein IKP00_11820 [Victivallales bacterium]|nr:hypothetical protein [Victivallales bacterium]
MKTMKKLATVLAVLPLFVGADVIRLYATSQTTLTIPGEAGATIVSKPAGLDCAWVPVPFTATDKGLSMTLQPPADGKELLLLVNPAKDWNINDRKAPELKSLLVNGKPMKVEKNVVSVPDDVVVNTIGWSAVDVDNLIDAKQTVFLLDDAPIEFALDGNKADGKLTMEQKIMGNHAVKIRVVDSAPEANTTEVTLHFRYADKNTLLNPQNGLAKITVDSCYDGYNSLAPLNDGVLKLPGSSAGGDVTWASAEIPTEHWVRMDFKKDVTVKEGYIFWPRLENSSKKVELQMLQGDKWVKLAGTPDAGQKDTLTTSFTLKAPATGRSFRFWQPKGGGPTGRGDILWICEIILK